jgi:CRISPR-associated protein Cas5d
VKKGAGYQLLATVLIDVCYRLYAEVIPVAQGMKSKISEGASLWDRKTTSPGHAYQDIFARRLNRGQCFCTPFLGWKEFAPSYFGLFRSGTTVESSINTVLPSMLREVFPKGYGSPVKFTFDQNVPIKNGVIEFPQKGDPAHA